MSEPAQRPRFKRLLRAVAVVALLAWLAQQASFERLLQDIGALRPGPLLVALCTIFLTNCLRAANWHQLLRGLGVVRQVDYLRTLYCHFCGGLFGQMIPSTAGMDAARACLAYTSFGSHVAVTGASVFILNAVSWMSACAFGLLGLRFLVAERNLPHAFDIAAVFFLGTIVGVVAAYLLLQRQQASVLRRFADLHPRWNVLGRAVRKFIESLLLFERARVRLLPVFLLAALVHLGQAANLGLVADAVGVSIGLAEALVLLPLGALANLAPLSVAGFGLPQLAVGTALILFGVSPSQALLVASLWAAANLAVNATAGGIAYLAGRPAKPLVPHKV